jgi:hypothetical protein
MLNVFITIDTECSMGGALDDSHSQPVSPERSVVGRIGSCYYGTPLIMDILERNGLRGTFFIEVLASHVVNQQQMADAYGEIVARGHDVQLHLHPVYHYYRLLRQGLITNDQLPQNMDLIGTLPLSAQLQLLREGIDLAQKLTGRTPIAFRAGCFGASTSTLVALAEVGIEYDSSFNAVYLGKTCLIDAHQPTNIPWRAGRVWEIPITNFETGIGWLRGLKPLDVVAVSWPEMKQVLDSAGRLNLQTVVFILHSFSFLKRKDLQFRTIRPDHLVIRRFEALCDFLGKNSKRLHVRTFAERPQISSSSGSGNFPKLGSLLPLCRKLVQGVNRLYWL